jgi:hypothetical protein
MTKLLMGLQSGLYGSNLESEPVVQTVLDGVQRLRLRSTLPILLESIAQLTTEDFGEVRRAGCPSGRRKTFLAVPRLARLVHVKLPLCR